MAEIFLAGVLVSFVKLMAYGDIGIGTSFVPFVLFCLLQLLAFQSLDRRWLWNDIVPPWHYLRSWFWGKAGYRKGCVRAHVVPLFCQPVS